MAIERKPAEPESGLECPYRIEYIDRVPDGVEPHHHDRYSMFKSFGKDTTLFYSDEKEMPSCIFYHAPTRTRWRLFFGQDANVGVNADFMTALIEAHERGLF